MAAIGLAEALLVQAQTCFGIYILSLTSDDASYLWLDNPARHATLLSSEAIIKNSGQHAAQTGSATVALTAGNHGTVVHFGEQDGENVLILAYGGSDTGNPSVVVPATGHSYRWCSLGSQPSPSQTYETLDRAPLAGLAYYRQRLVDHDGTTAYPLIVAIMMTTRRAATNGLAAQVLPNPALVAGPLNLRVQ